MNLPTGVSAGTISETTVSITDNDHPNVEVSFEQSGYSVTEGSGVIVKVKLNADPEREVIIPIRRTNQGASDSDYSGVPTSVTFDSGDTEKSFTFTADDDADDDDGESVKLTFVNLPAGVSAGTTDEAVVSITDNDAPSSLTVNFRAGTYTVTEGSTVEVVLTLDDDPERTVIIPIDRDNQDGASDSDYSGVPTSVTFNSGDTSKSFMFSAASDRIGDPGEKVSINLGPLPPGVTEGTTSETVVTIEDVALSGSTTVSFGADIYGVSEGSSTTITVVMSPAPGSDAIIRIDDEGQDGATSADYSVVPASLTFGATETSKTFTFTATDDADNDDGESVKLTFVNLPTGVSAGTISETTVSITDNDHPAVEVSFEQSGYSVTEGSGVIVKVKLNADPEREVIIPIRRMNQGASDDDYSGVPTSVTFDSGDTEKSFTFTATQDSVDDDGESVKLSFDSSLPDGVSAGTTDETTVSITDDDVSAVEVSFEHSSYTVTEGETETVRVKLNADPEREVIIPIRRMNQGASDDDYSGVPVSVVFNSGDTEQTFTFTATQDSVDDDGESVKLSFDSSLPDGVSAGTTDETTVSITDDDAPSSLTVNFKKSGYTVTEGSIEEIMLTLDDDPARTVSIPLSWSNEDGASDSDHNGVPTDVTFNAGDTSKSFEFSAVSDRIGDPGEKVSINLGSLPPGVTEGTTSETVVTIEDVALSGSTTVSFGADIYGVSEGSSTTITVVMSPAPGSDAIIRIEIEDEDGASSADYSLSATSVTFGPTETSKTFTFTANQDSVDDDGESVDLGFGPLPGRVSAGLVPKTVVSITDDDDPAVEVSFEHSSYSVTEGSGVIVKVKLNADPEREVIIPIRRMNQGASDDDYSGVPTSVTFDSGDTEKSFTFTATQDSVDDDGESVKLSFDSSLPDGVSAGTTDETTVSITDDDETVMQVSFGKSNYTVDEGHEMEVMVRLAPAPDHRMDIQLQKTNMNGASDGDYSGVPTMVTFNSGETEKSFTFFAEPDEVYDDREAVELSFVALPAMVREGDPSKAMVSLRDNGGITCIDNNRANIVTVLSRRGLISSSGEIDTWVIPGVDPHRTYLVEILGADSGLDVWGQDVGGSLTLADPHPVSLYHEDGSVGNQGYNSAAGDFGAGRNSRFIFVFSTFGDFVLKVKSGESVDGQGTGSYHLLVRYDNYCIVRDDGSILFPFEGGPEGYAFDIRDDTGTRRQVNVRYSTDIHRRPYLAGGHLLGDNWGSEPDEDWFRFELEGDTEYEVYLEGAPQFPVEHRLTRPRIVGIFDEDGRLFHEGAAGSGTDTSVSLNFQTTSSGFYYLGVGSNPGDRTGMYSFHVRQTESTSAGHASTNSAPTGGPGITGLPRIGEVLTATTSGIADADGLENASFSYRWVRHEPLANTDTDIPGATGSTYKVARQDRDRAIKVRVEFTDDDGNDEKLTSFALLILPPVNTPATGQPTIAGTLEVGQILTADTYRISDADGMDNATFGYRWIAGESAIQNATGMSHTLTEDEEGLAIRVSVTFTDDAGNEEPLTSTPSGLVQPRPNAPVIRGAARVGETLTADTSGISDADGMENASFAYRWLAGGTDIPGATGSNYTLTEDEVGLTIQVWVSFIDDAGNPESLTSVATPAVTDTAPTERPPAPENLTAVENAGGSVTLTWDAPDDDSVTGYQILRREPAAGEYSVAVYVADTGSAATSFTDTDVAAGTKYVYRVKAINDAGVGPQSGRVMITTND